MVATTSYLNRRPRTLVRAIYDSMTRQVVADGGKPEHINKKLIARLAAFTAVTEYGWSYNA